MFNCNVLLLLNKSIYLNIYCCLTILICLILCFVISKKSLLLKKIFLNKTVVFVCLTLAFASCAIVLVEANGNNNIENDDEYIFFKDDSTNNGIKDISLNKIIIVGDSRMEYIETDPDINIPSNISFVAHSGMKIEWFSSDAMNKLNEILSAKSDYTYHVVLNMGINDLNFEKSGKIVANNYYNLYKKLISKYPNDEFYILSINPVDEKLIKKTRPTNIRTNAEIENANLEYKRLIKSSTYTNVTFCDSYSAIDFDTEDGLHFTKDTNKKIIDYISNDCIQYKKSPVRYQKNSLKTVILN